MEKETKGAWLIHHGRKIMLDVNGAAEFPAIDEAAKAAMLLIKLGQTDHIEVSMSKVRAIAMASGLNPRYELDSLLKILKRKRLIEQSGKGDQISILGVTTTGALGNAVDIYQDAEPRPYEQASLNLAELASRSPVRHSDISEKIADEHRLSNAHVKDFLNRAEGIGFVDKEGDGDDRLLYNGNLFRRGSVAKSQKVLASLTEDEQRRINVVADRLSKEGCLLCMDVETILSEALFKKLAAAGIYDLNQVTNEKGYHVYVTAPSAFHKFVDPLVDDCFDMAKSLVAALMYGMTSRPASQGKINLLPRLLGKLIDGREVGPATAIGRDYRALEVSGVVELRRSEESSNMFYMKLLKKEVGRLALHVLTQGDASAESLVLLPGAPMESYIGPEESRVSVRRKQSTMSKRKTRDILEAVRGGQPF